MKETSKVLEFSEFKIIKTVNIVAKNNFGNDFVIGFFIYERELNSNYRFESKNENEKDFFRLFNYPNESDYPKDELDEIILNSVLEYYSNSYIKSELLFSSSDIERLENKTKRPFEKTIIWIKPSLVGKDLTRLQQQYTILKIPINVYVQGSSELIKNLYFESNCDFDRKNEIYDKLELIKFK